MTTDNPDLRETLAQLIASWNALADEIDDGTNVTACSLRANELRHSAGEIEAALRVPEAGLRCEIHKRDMVGGQVTGWWQCPDCKQAGRDRLISSMDAQQEVLKWKDRAERAADEIIKLAVMRDRLIASMDALREALIAARKFVRGRHSTLTYGPQALLDQIDAALAVTEPK